MNNPINKIKRFLCRLNEEYDYDLGSPLSDLPEPKSRKESADQQSYLLGEKIIDMIEPQNVKLARVMLTFMEKVEESHFQDLSNPDFDNPLHVLESAEVDARMLRGADRAKVVFKNKNRDGVVVSQEYADKAFEIIAKMNIEYPITKNKTKIFESVAEQIGYGSGKSVQRALKQFPL